MQYLDLHKLNAPYEDDIKQALLDVVDTGWYLFGKQVSAFEQEWADYNHAPHCVACANGLDALRLVLRAWMEMGFLHEGDGVIVPANTYIASILAVSDNGLIPIPVEPNPVTYLIDSKNIEKAILEQRPEVPVRVILPVHLYGQQCEMDAINAIALRHGLLVLQDGAQSHGIPVSGTCAWSFYPGKNLGALGDAGAVTSDDFQLVEIIRQLAFYGSERKYVHKYKGLNSRMDELQAAVLRIKLKDLDATNQRRQQIALRYCTEIQNSFITLPESLTIHHVYHIFPILCEQRNELQLYLKKQGIETQVHYPIAPHQQRAYSEWNNLSFPITERIARCELSLPCNQTMTDEEVSQVINALNHYDPEL